MVQAVKITSLNDIGTSIMYTTLVPVVNMTGTPTTEKANLQIVGNLILNGAGGSYFPPAAQATVSQFVAYAAQPNITSVGTLTSLQVAGNINAGNANLGNLAIANVFSGTLNGSAVSANIANTVAVNAQPNITSVGTLTSLNVTGLANLGAVSSIVITGGSANYVLQTDGFGNLSWAEQTGGSTGNITFDAANISTDLADTDIQIIGNGTGNVNIVANSQVWTFDANGNLYIPDRLGSIGTLYEDGIDIIAPTGGYAELASGNLDNFVYVEDNGVYINTNRTDSEYQWQFDLNGGLTFPDSTFAAPDLEGTGDFGFEMPADVGFTILTDLGNSQWTFGADGYMRIPNDGSFGALNSSVLAFSSQNNVPIYIEVVDTANNEARQWVFDNTGNLTLPDTTSIIAGAAIAIEANSTGNTTGLGLNGDADALLYAHANIIINTDINGTDNIWTFDKNGNLTLPTAGALTLDGVGLRSSGSIGQLFSQSGTLAVCSITAGVQILADNGDHTWQFGSGGALTFPSFTYAQGNIDGFNNFGFEMPAGNGFAILANTGNSQWTFGTDGNLVLPGTGTINNQTNSSLDPTTPTASTMVLTPDSNYLYQALVLDPTSPGHIHLRSPATSGGNIDQPTANIFLGGELSSFEVGASYGDVPNVFIHSGGNTWTFGTDGNLTTPGVAGNITGANVISANTFVIQGNTILGQTEGSNTVGFYNADPTEFLLELGANPWSFNGNTGYTLFPILTTQRGDNPSGTISGYTLNGSDGNQEFIITTSDGNVTVNNSQRIVINPGMGAGNTAGEGGDIYLWAGRGGNGDAGNAISGGSGGDIKIRGGQGGGVNGFGGYIRMEAGDGATSGGAGFIEITGGAGGTGQNGGYVRILSGQGAINGGDANLTGGTGTAGTGGTVNIVGGASGLGLADYGNVNIISGASTWRFDNTGNLTTPGSIITAGSGGNITLTGGSIIGANVVSANAVNVTGNVTVAGWVDGVNTVFTGAIAGNVLTVTGAVDGSIARGQTIYGNTVLGNTVIVLQLTESSANAGGNGTYRVTNTQTVSAEAMYVNSLYLDGDLKLAADHGVYVRDVHDPYQYDNLIGISEVDATVLIGSLNTNGVTLDNNKEYKVDSALNPGTYMAVAKVNAADEVILSSGNSANTLIRVGGDSATTGYAVKFLNGGEGLMPVGLRIGDNTNSSIFAAPLEVGSRLQGAPNNQSSPGGIALPTYRGTGTIIANDEYGSYVYGSRYRGTINSPLPVKDGDWLMEFGATAFDGTNNNGGGEIAFRVAGTVTGSSNPSNIEFYNTVTGANNQSLGMVLDASQKLTVTGNIAGANISTTGNISGNTNGYTIGYLNIPQVAASNTTIALSDAGKHYYSTSAGNFTLTIPNNASASFATGTAISIVVQSAGNVLVNAVSGVNLYMAGNSTAANRVVSNYGMATLLKVATDTWMINGTGVA
jgi:hypothetical protein